MAMLEFKQSLARRILIGFVLLTILVAGSFAVGVFTIVNVLEERLITSELGGQLNLLLRMDNMDDWRPHPRVDQIFYFDGGKGEYALPEDVRNLSPGYHKVFRPDGAYHAVVAVVDGRKYVLLQDQSAFLERKRILFAVVLVGFILSLGLAVALGSLVARQVIVPVVRLAAQVRRRKRLMSPTAPLAGSYPNDEVGELAAAFDDTLGHLREVLNRERLFTSDVRPELRTPLMVLASSCELLRENPSLDERCRAQIGRMSRATEEMRQLVQTFLLLARADSKQDDQTPKASLPVMADELVSLWGGQIEAKGLRFEYRNQCSCNDLYNAPLLRSVMGNLLRNAWHYTERGHITLALEDHGFSVEDSGKGVPENQRRDIFRPFVRGRDERRGEGLGLGLSLVQLICESQGWQVSLEPSASGGCCFRVELAVGAKSQLPASNKLEAMA